MKTQRSALTLSLALNCMTAFAFAQQPAGPALQADGFCGTIVTAEQIERELEWQDAGLFDGVWTRGADFNYIRVAIHIVRYSDGSGGINLANIQIGLDEANDEFADSRLVFIPIYRDFIDNSTYADIADGTEGDALRQINVVPGALNIYFVPNAPYCGQSTFPSGVPGSDGGPQGIIMSNSCTALGGILAHEIGHYFMLYHTHETGFGPECPGLGNCGALGDLVCDTPPDPGLHSCDGSLGSCVNNCTYIGTARCDTTGLLYAPDVHNTMSYTDPECMIGFSAGQEVRIAAALTLPDRSDEIAFQNSCGRPTYAQPGTGVGLGVWAAPDYGLRAAISRAANRCPGGGVVIAIRGNYNEGTAVFNTPMTIVASRNEGSGDVVIRP